jgi:hypothetical protein
LAHVDALAVVTTPIGFVVRQWPILRLVGYPYLARFMLFKSTIWKKFRWEAATYRWPYRTLGNNRSSPGSRAGSCKVTRSIAARVFTADLDRRRRSAAFCTLQPLRPASRNVASSSADQTLLPRINYPRCCSMGCCGSLRGKKPWIGQGFFLVDASSKIAVASEIQVHVDGQQRTAVAQANIQIDPAVPDVQIDGDKCGLVTVAAIVSSGAAITAIRTIVGMVRRPAVIIRTIRSGIVVSRAVRSGIPAIAVIGRVTRLPVMIAVIAGIALTIAVLSTISTMVIVVIRPICGRAVSGRGRGGSGACFLVIGLRCHCSNSTIDPRPTSNARGDKVSPVGYDSRGFVGIRQR